MKTAVYIYVPVVHSGILKFLDEYKDIPVWLLDNEVGKMENVYLERDMRALPAEKIKVELNAHGYMNIEVVPHTILNERVTMVEELIIPEDEIVKFFVKKFAPHIRIRTVNTFLRWTKQISTNEFIIPNDRVITEDVFVREMLHGATNEAQKSPDWWRQIGAAIVKSGEVLTLTYNKHYPTQHAVEIDGDPRSNLDAGEGTLVYRSIHAEAWAIADLARKGVSTEGADMYVTTFPCPACARLLVEAGFRRVFYQKGYSLLDAEEILKNADIEIILVKE